MSLFRKPNRKFRQRLHHSDTEDEAEVTNVEEEKSPPRVETPAAAVEAEESKAPASLLSFGDDDEEETEVFKVRKSTYSRRLAKQLERDRKKKLREATKVEVKPEPEPLPSALPEKPSARPFSDELEIKIKNTFKILNSEEIKGSESEEEEEGEGPQYRRLRNVIQSGVIPDAATIYALKKRRQMAREMGDFIPLEQEDQKGRAGEEEDQSEDEEGRINFTVNTAAIEKQRAREALIQAQEEQSGDEVAREDVAELERWEQEQMKKGVSTAPVAAVPTPEEPCIVPAYFTEQPVPLLIQDRQNLSSQAVLERITDRLNTVREMLALHRRQKTQALTDLEVSAEASAQLREEQPQLETNFRFFQEMRSYAADLIECLDAKTPVILALEGRMMSLFCQRSEKLVQRRHQDIKDQAEECNLAVKGLRGLPVEPNNRGSQQRSWRAAEREGRRVRRRKAREAQQQGLAQQRNLAHHDGMSTDDEQPDADRLAFDKERELILDDARHVFEDVTEHFSNVASLKQKFERWKQDFGESYEQAYIPLCLVKLLVPFVRLQMVAWNPIEKPESPEGCGWYEALLFYGEDTPDDPDLCLLPRVVERALLPKMAALAEKVWDPMSSTQTLNLVRTAKKLVEDYPTVNAQSRHLQNFLAKVAARISRALDEDVYIPLYPKEVLENRSGAPAAFFHRQFWSCLKLMKNVLSWQGLLAEEPLKELSLCSLLNRYLIVALQAGLSQRDTVEKCTRLVSTLPTAWLRGSPLPQLELLTRFLRLYRQHLEGLCASSALGPDMHARDALDEVGKLLASLTDKAKS
ncbi:PAX3- and PAX7-binding protein 1 [Dermacentor variabilis]|uniref:PAX3- and PAX7-binding protein 1 n=1 Tax=Dermacentor variabilis TaxID=34621 RepID=UPI003F5C169C